MTSRPYMKFYPGDYLQDTIHLSTAQHGAYLLLILRAWSSDKPLPDDDAKLAKLTMQNRNHWMKMKDDILDFFYHDGDGWRSKRVEKDKVEFEKLSVKRAQSAKQGHQKRQAKSLKNNESDVANAQQMHSNCTANGSLRARVPTSEPESERRITPLPPTDEVLEKFATEEHRSQTIDWYDEFERFIRDYPKGPNLQSPKKSRTAFEMAVIAGADPVKIANAAKPYADTFAKKPEAERKFIKAPHNFISEEIWREFADQKSNSDLVPPEMQAHWDKRLKERGR